MISMKNQMSFFITAVFQALIYFLLIEVNYSAPVNSSVTYANFLKEIKHENCVFPKNVKLPFNSSGDTFEYLEFHIKICSPSKEKNLKRSLEAIKICSDIFDILKNITCHPETKAQLPEIKIEFSSNVCADVGSLEFSLESKTLLQHLKDSLICDMMCDDEFNPACQVLLWSYQIQQQLNKAVVEQKNSKKIEAVNSGAAAEQKNNELEEEVNKDNPVVEKKENVLSEGGTVVNKDKLNSGIVENSQNVLSNQKLTPDEMEKSNHLVIPKNTTHSEENLNNANSEIINLSEKDKHEKSTTPAKLSSVNDVKSLVKIHLPNKEKEINNQILIDNLSDKSNHKIAKVDQLSLKSTANQADNPKINDVVNKTKQHEAKDIKPIPEEAGLVDETESKIQNPVPSGNLPETAKNSYKGESKIKAQTPAKVETSSVGKTATQIKDILKVIPEEAKDTKISTLKTEEKIKGTVEETNQNTVSETFTEESNNLEDVSPITTAADLEKMEEGNEIPEPSDKNQEPYNDADDGFYDSSKNKKTDFVEDSKMPVVESQNELPKYDVYQSRNSMGRGVEDIQVIPAFPEQEDSHFFFYFLSIVLILMGGYLVFHNKQKIIALIVEGRHERRRRSHGVGYKKLETK